MKIDYVVPFVDMQDPEWRRLYSKYISKEQDENFKNRYAPNRFFKYVFRGIDQHMPWINNVFLLVQSDSQVPDWINRKTVKIVTHDQFIPARYLPAFNSCTIESFLHMVPGLANFFIYGNDDTYVFDSLSEDNFFKDGMPLIQIRNKIIRTDDVHAKLCRNVQKTVDSDIYVPHHEKLCRIPEHVQTPMSKVIVSKIYDQFKAQIDASITRQRSAKNLGQYFYQMYYSAATSFKYKTKIPSVAYSLVVEKNKIIEMFKQKRKPPLVCFNDNDGDGDIFIMCLLEKVFPKKSRYEI